MTKSSNMGTVDRYGNTLSLGDVVAVSYRDEIQLAKIVSITRAGVSRLTMETTIRLQDDADNVVLVQNRTIKKKGK